ncbi:MAG: T9SS type A sorting domain-containing protein [Crocinitomicaceae bacterium]
MRNLKLIFLSFFCFSVLGAKAQSLYAEWAKSAGSGTLDIGTTLTIDHSGNILISGSYRYTVDFDPGPSVYNLSSSNTAGFILKLDSAGNFIWARSIPDRPQNYDKSIAVDINDNIYLVGSYWGTLDFDPSPLNVYNLSSNGSDDIFILKLDSNGNFVWVHSFGDTAYDQANGIVIDHNQNLCVAGSFRGNVDFDPGVSIYNLTSTANSLGLSKDIFILKLDTLGQFIWAKSIGGEQSDNANAVDVDSIGNIYTTGSYREMVDFNPSPTSTYNLNSALFSEDIFVLKLDSLGDFVWANSFGSYSSGDEGNSISVDPFGDLLIAGEFNNTVDFDPSGSTANLTATSTLDNFVLKLTANGSFGWVKRYNYVRSVVSDLSGNAHYLGSAIGKVDVNGNALWTEGIGVYGNSIAVSQSNEIYATGFFLDTVDIDPSTSVLELYSNGNRDIFVAKFNFCENSGVDVITACNSYEWIDGITYTSNNNTATFTVTNVNGCDSIVSLDLTIYQSSFGADTVIACDNYTWFNGVTYYSTSDSISDTLINTEGCDSIITLNLTILESTNVIDSVVACESYTWINGVTYYSSTDTVVASFIKQNGCDSIVNLDLTIKQHSSGIDSITVCDQMTWIDGITYTSSNNAATFTLVNAAGCDSIVALNLTVLSSTTVSDVISSCGPYTWIDGVTYTVSNNTAMHTLTNSIGCDSIIELDLSITSIDLGVSTNISTITASSGINITYQWLDCNANFMGIIGENNQIFNPTAIGAYAVEITQNNCVDTSECVNIIGIASVIESEEIDFKYYPNPTSGALTLEFKQERNYNRIVVLNLNGEILSKYDVNKSTMQIPFSYSKGLYLVQLIGENDIVKLVKIVKE